jgi:hypothetical protein
MEPSEPPEPDPRGARPEGSSAERDALRRLEERLERASDVAERLIAEAAAASAASAGRAAESAAGAAAGAARAAAGAAAGGGESAGSAGAGPPPAGWQEPSSDAAAAAGGDGELLAQVVQSLRELVPPDLQRKLAEALRELLLAVRALIDWYLERVEQRRAEPAEVQDIPIM